MQVLEVAGETTAPRSSGWKPEGRCWTVELVGRHVTTTLQGKVKEGLVVEVVAVKQGVVEVVLQVCMCKKFKETGPCTFLQCFVLCVDYKTKLNSMV
jgi:hypothetical protein